MTAEPTEARIERIVAGGDGLARSPGGIVFVPGTAPGELHRVEIVEEKKDYARGRSVECLEPAPERRPPPCPHYERCGGCPLMHLEPEAQLEAKKGILLESLRRTAKQDYDGPVETIASPELGYRLRLRFHVAVSRGGPVLGFRRRGSHEIVDIDRCLLGTEALAAAWTRVRKHLRSRPLVAQHLRSIELIDSSAEPGRMTARFVVRSPDGIRRIEGGRGDALLEELGVEGLVVEVERGGPMLRLGRTWVEHRVGKWTLRQSAGSFFQTNRYLLEPLVRAALPDEREPEAPRALDLYCGVGLFTLPLAERAGSVVGVENSSLAISDAKHNVERSGIDNVRLLRSDAARFVARGTLRRDDLVVADPPRGGLERGLVEALARSPLERLRYVSCDPPSFARDVGVLARVGFRIDALTLLDLFPSTHLFETVALLSRRE